MGLYHVTEVASVCTVSCSTRRLYHAHAYSWL